MAGRPPCAGDGASAGPGATLIVQARGLPAGPGLGVGSTGSTMGAPRKAAQQGVQLLRGRPRRALAPRLACACRWQLLCLLPRSLREPSAAYPNYAPLLLSQVRTLSPPHTHCRSCAAAAWRCACRRANSCTCQMAAPTRRVHARPTSSHWQPCPHLCRPPPLAPPAAGVSPTYMSLRQHSWGPDSAPPSPSSHPTSPTPPLAQVAVLRMLIDAAQGLEYLASLGVVHGDVKARKGQDAGGTAQPAWLLGWRKTLPPVLQD